MENAIPFGMLPVMVDKTTAAALCMMSVATYDKYARRKLLPPMNETGRVSVEALKEAARKLDNLKTGRDSDDADAILAAWESQNEDRRVRH